MTSRQLKKLEHAARKAKDLPLEMPSIGDLPKDKTQRETTRPTLLPPQSLGLGQPTKARWLKSIWSGVEAVAVILAFIGAAYQFSPSVTLSIGERLDSANALSYQLIVSNDGSVPVYDLSVGCTSGTVAYTGGGSVTIEAGGSLHILGDDAKRLSPGQKFTTAFVCYTPQFGITPSWFDFVVEISYKHLLPWRTASRFRLASSRDNRNGRLIITTVRLTLNPLAATDCAAGG